MSDPEQGKPRDTEGHAWERQKHSESLGAINALVEELKTQRQGQDVAEHKKALRERVTIALVFLTVVATGFGDWIFFNTMGEARDAAANAHIDNVAALTAAQTAANGQHQDTVAALSKAEAANATARDTANRQLRAYIFVIARDVRDLSAGKSPRWGINYSVLGQTPAYDVGIRGFTFVSQYPGTPSYVLNSFIAAKPKNTNKAMAFPSFQQGADFVFYCHDEKWKDARPCTLSAESSALIADSKSWRLFTAGIITYRDTFGKVHNSPFCFSYKASEGKSEWCDKTPTSD